MVVIGGDGGADEIFAFFFDGVLLSQKTHGLLLASVFPHWVVTYAIECDMRGAAHPP